jgi:hypothetical protein
MIWIPCLPNTGDSDPDSPPGGEPTRWTAGLIYHFLAGGATQRNRAPVVAVVGRVLRSRGDGSFLPSLVAPNGSTPASAIDPLPDNHCSAAKGSHGRHISPSCRHQVPKQSNVPPGIAQARMGTSKSLACMTAQVTATRGRAPARPARDSRPFCVLLSFATRSDRPGSRTIAHRGEK